jgi:hypothetical protein
VVLEKGGEDKLEAVLHGVKEERNILHTVRRRKANWIGHILRRNCLLTKDYRDKKAKKEM